MSDIIVSENLESLKEENNKITTALVMFKEKLIEIQYFTFSSKSRPILFSLTSKSKREPIVDKILNQLLKLRNHLKIIHKWTETYINNLKKSELSQKKHKKKTIKYAYSGLHLQKKIINNITSLLELIEKLKKFQGRKTSQKILNKLKKLFEETIEYFDQSHVYISDFMGRYRIEKYISQTYDDLLNYNLYSHGGRSKIKSGDLFVSFKTLRYIKRKNARVSRQVFQVTGSQITHVNMFMKMGMKLYTLDYGDEFDYVEELNQGKNPEYFRLVEARTLRDGEVFIILRPKLSDNQRIRLWKEAREMVKMKIKYSKKKAIAVVPSLMLHSFKNLFTKRHIGTGNILRGLKLEMFCSEIINVLFQRVGFTLTPKMSNSGMVYPADILVSPNVEYVGLMFLPGKLTKEKIMKELVKGVSI